MGAVWGLAVVHVPHGNIYFGEPCLTFPRSAKRPEMLEKLFAKVETECAKRMVTIVEEPWRAE